MKQTLPKNNVNKWLVLTVVAIFSLAATYAVYNISASNQSDTASAVPTQIETAEQNPNNNENEMVTIDTQYNIEGGYVDIYLNSTALLTVGEVVFDLGEGASFDSIDNSSLFVDYAVQSTDPKVVRVSGLNVAGSEPVKPTQNSEMFARVYFTGLTEGNVTLNVQESSFVNQTNQTVAIVN